MFLCLLLKSFVLSAFQLPVSRLMDTVCSPLSRVYRLTIDTFCLNRSNLVTALLFCFSVLPSSLYFSLEVFESATWLVIHDFIFTYITPMQMLNNFRPTISYSTSQEIVTCNGYSPAMIVLMSFS